MDRYRLVAALAAISLISLACVSAEPSVSPTGSPAASSAVAGATGTPTMTATPETTVDPPQRSTPTPVATESLTEDFDPTEFGEPTVITNRWLPLTPGTRWVHEGSATVDGIRIPRRVVLVVSDVVKTIAGVRAVVGYELDYDADELVEAELVFWAQADDGTVWHLGQYPESYENGVLVETPIWIHGYEDANAGIVMKAAPAVFGPSYSQGWGPAVDWTDRARVFETGSVTCVPLDCYEDVLVIDEFNRDEPDAHQLKYYAVDVGNVRVGWAGAREDEQEVLELVQLEQISAQELARVRQQVLRQDARGYENSPDLYALTPPAR